MEIALPIPGLLDGMEKRILGRLAEEVEEWSRFLPALADWEDANLVEKPTPELLAQHKMTVEHAIRVGKILQLATGQPEFPDHALAASVRATLQGLQDMLDMRHGPRMTEQRREEILTNCFPE